MHYAIGSWNGRSQIRADTSVSRIEESGDPSGDDLIYVPARPRLAI